MPVLLGTDVGTYSFARMFHEHFGCRSITLSGTPRGPINKSKILTNVFLGRGGMLDREGVVRALEQIARDHRDKTLLLMTFGDADVTLALENRDRLEKAGFTIPLAEREIVERANSKSELTRICQELGLAVPATVELVASDTEEMWRSQLCTLTYPAILKPRDGGTGFVDRLFEGQKKVYSIANTSEAITAMKQLVEHGFSGAMLAQEMVMGGDDASWIITGYRNQHGKITSIATGRQVVALHQSNFIGNASIIHVTDNPGLRNMAASVCNKIRLRGLFSIDVKIDSRTGVPYLLDVNPRWGRGSYFSVVGGTNMARDIVADFVDGEAADPVIATTEGVYHFVPLSVLRHWVRDDELKKRVKSLKNVVHPLDYKADRHPKRLLYRRLADINQVRALRATYPHPTPTGF